MRDVSDAKKIGAIKYTLKIGHSDDGRTATLEEGTERKFCRGRGEAATSFGEREVLLFGKAQQILPSSL